MLLDPLLPPSAMAKTSTTKAKTSTTKGSPVKQATRKRKDATDVTPVSLDVLQHAKAEGKRHHKLAKKTRSKYDNCMNIMRVWARQYGSSDGDNTGSDTDVDILHGDGEEHQQNDKTLWRTFSRFSTLTRL